MFKILDVYNESFITKEIFGIVLSELFYWTTFHFHLTFGIFIHFYLFIISPCLSIYWFLVYHHWVIKFYVYFECTEFTTERSFLSPNLIRSNNLSFRLQKIQKYISIIFQLDILNIIFFMSKICLLTLPRKPPLLVPENNFLTRKFYFLID